MSTRQSFSNDQVKEMGRKARLRLEEEKSKRKEIVRLNDDLLIAPPNISTMHHNAERTSQFAMAIQQSTLSKTAATKVARPQKKRRTAATRSTRTGHGNIAKGKLLNKNVDTWAPSTGGLLYYDLPKEEKSDIIRIHGLPIGATVEDLKKFFVGLYPSHFFVLLSFEASIQGFDSTNDASHPNKEEKEKRSLLLVDRHGPEFRLCVKFPSYITADVALQRSGELLHINTHDDQNENVSTVAASISLSPISRQVGRYIENYLAIDCNKYITNEGCRGGFKTIFSHALAEAEKSIPPIINQILWANAARVLKWKIDIQKRDHDCSHSIQEAFQTTIIISPKTSQEEKQRIVTLHNHLVTIYEDLERQSSPFHFHHKVIDPCVSSRSNSNSMICQRAAELLLDRISSIQKALCYSFKF